MRFAWADPPYFGMGAKLYGELHPEAADWDDKETHFALIEKLTSEYPDGWALACNPRDLRWLLPACPDTARVAAWTKTYHQIRPTSVQYAWEPVIWHGGRSLPKRSPMVRDWLSCAVTRMRGTPGAKPDIYNRWIADLLGYQDGDTIDDLFPGSGGMGTQLAQGDLFALIAKSTHTYETDEIDWEA